VKNAKPLAVVGAVVVLVGWLFVSLTACGNQKQSTSIGSSTATAVAPTVALESLPPEAVQTHTLILEGGPFPYSQDGQVFGNREQLLPDQEYGWYREYTVETPGSDDRGARRFVVGDDEVFFYTDDHYGSFREVIP
jgi:ribonuclease T1